jgi:signal peptidase I
VFAAVREVVVVVALALVLSLIVKTWLAQAFFIPSGSMEDTLLVGDRVIVSKLTPRYLPLERGDIVVFEDPGGWLPAQAPTARGPVLDAVHRALVFVGLEPASEDHLIKRVIGLPGDHVVCCSANQRLMVNGTEIDETPYVRSGDAASALTFDIVVPPGRIWVMGDHRSDSEDSRYHDPNGDGKGGSVAIDRVTGRAVFRLWPIGRAGTLSPPHSVFAPVPTPGTTSP